MTSGESGRPGYEETALDLTPEEEKILRVLGSEFQEMYADVA